MPIDSLVDIEEHHLALLRGDAPLEDARSTMSIYLIVVDQVPFGPTREVSGFGFVIWYIL
jgi:hypothetical protein